MVGKRIDIAIFTNYRQIPLNLDPHHIISSELSIAEISEILQKRKKIKLSEESLKKIVDCRNYLEQKLSGSDVAYYGINTGFGALCNTRIPDSDLDLLQKKLVSTHTFSVFEIGRVEIK